MKNKKLIKWAGIASLLIIFAIATQWSMDDGTKPMLTHETSPAMADIDIPDNVKKAESKEEVMKFYESLTPGITKAKSLEIATSPKQTYSIPEHEGKLYINNVWYTRDVIFIYYSYDLTMFEASDSKEEPIKKLPVGIADVQMEALDGDIPTQSFGGHLNTARPKHSIAYNGKLHTFTAIPPIRQKDAGNFQRRRGVPFNQTVLTSFHVEVNDNRYKTDASPINFTYAPEESILKTAKSDKVFQDKGLVIKPKKLEVGLTDTRVILNMEHQSFPITTSFRATLKSNHGEEKELRYLAPYEENQKLYVASFAPFEKIPDTVTLTIEQVGLQSDQDYSFTVDVTDYKDKMGKNNRGEEVNVGKQVATLFNTDVYLKKKKYHLPDDSTFVLTFEPRQEDQAISLVPYNSFAMGVDQLEKPIIVENHEGRTDRSHMYSPDQETLHISVPALSIMGAKELEVTINKAAIGQRIDQDFTFELE